MQISADLSFTATLLCKSQQINLPHHRIWSMNSPYYTAFHVLPSLQLPSCHTSSLLWFMVLLTLLNCANAWKILLMPHQLSSVALKDCIVLVTANHTLWPIWKKCEGTWVQHVTCSNDINSTESRDRVYGQNGGYDGLVVLTAVTTGLYNVISLKT
jgi:hypothetical protein